MAAAATVVAAETEITSTEGPVMSVINKRIRALRKKLNRMVQMEESVSQGKTLNKEQEETLRSKPLVVSAIDELEKLRAPISTAVSEEISLALKDEHHQRSTNAAAAAASSSNNNNNGGDLNSNIGGMLVDLLPLLYFGSMFDVKSQSVFHATMLGRTHERAYCLAYDYVTDDDAAADLLKEKDLDMLSMLSSSIISHPGTSGLSHKDALLRCVDHAKLWLSSSQTPIHTNAAHVSYAGLRERLRKIMASDYYTTALEMKATIEMAAASAGGNYAYIQVPANGEPHSGIQYQQKEEDVENLNGDDSCDNQSSPSEDPQNCEVEKENHAEVVSDQPDQTTTESDHSQRDVEPKEHEFQQVPRRNYVSQRGGRGGGGRRGYYSNGRGGQSGGRRGGGYQNDHNSNYDQPGNYYARNYNNVQGRGGRGGWRPRNNHGPAVRGGRLQGDVQVDAQ